MTTGITDLAGNALSADKTITFTTANTAPTANSFTYGTAIGNSAKTFDWKILSGATDPEGQAMTGS